MHLGLQSYFAQQLLATVKCNEQLNVYVEYHHTEQNHVEDI